MQPKPKPQGLTPAINAAFVADLKNVDKNPTVHIADTMRRLSEWAASGNFPLGMTYGDLKKMYDECASELHSRDPNSEAGGNFPAMGSGRSSRGSAAPRSSEARCQALSAAIAAAAEPAGGGRSGRPANRAGFEPAPYHADPDETVGCPNCGRMNDTDASYCDQCDTKLAGRDDVKVAGTVDAPYKPQPYAEQSDETVVCPECGLRNDDDAEFCDQCGEKLAGNPNVTVSEPDDDDGSDDDDLDDDDPSDDDPGDISEESQFDPQRAGAPKENLVRFRRSNPGAPSVLLRDAAAPTDGQSGSVMFGYFATFNEWYEIDSWYEGTFLERVAPGAYQRTMVTDRPGMRVLYDHGFDPSLGNKPLGPITVLREDAIGAYYEVPLLDTDYNRNFLLPALRGQLMSGELVGSQLGASFRFIVTGEVWDRSCEVSATNPKGLPLRTITDTQVLEFGPVTFPANEGATSGVRCATDSFINRLRTDPLALARFTERTSYKVVERMLTGAPSTTSAGHTSNAGTTAPDGHAAKVSQLRRRARVLLTL